MTTPPDNLRRWLGLLSLVMAGGMLNWGHIVLRPYLEGWWAVAFWGVCLGLVECAVVFSVMEIIAIRRHIRIEHARLARAFLKATGRPPRIPRRSPHDHRPTPV